MKNVLFIVYYFPPMGGSGVQRPLKFIKYLREYGWNPIVVTPEPGVYHTFDESLEAELDALDIEVHRVKANTPFHKAGGKGKKLDIIPDWLAKPLRVLSTFLWLPDNKVGWIRPGVVKAHKVISDKNIDLIFSTAAPYSNHMIAARLKDITGKPVVMDMRDDWLESHLITYPTRYHKKKMAHIEQATLSKADVVTVINEDTLEGIDSRFNGKLDIKLVPQGFDPEDFDNREAESSIGEQKKLRFLYSGLFYGERKPDIFLEAISELFDEGLCKKEEIELLFQGGIDASIVHTIEACGLSDVVKDFGYVPHHKAVSNLLTADVLWLLVGHTHGNNQVTVGKMFEYFGSRKPILGMVPEGSSKKLLSRYKASFIAEPYNKAAVKEELKKIYLLWKQDKLPEPDPDFVNMFDRKQIAGQLAGIFDKVLDNFETRA